MLLCLTLYCCCCSCLVLKTYSAITPVGLYVCMGTVYRENSVKICLELAGAMLSYLHYITGRHNVIKFVYMLP